MNNLRFLFAFLKFQGLFDVCSRDLIDNNVIRRQLMNRQFANNESIYIKILEITYPNPGYAEIISFFFYYPYEC